MPICMRGPRDFPTVFRVNFVPFWNEIDITLDALPKATDVGSCPDWKPGAANGVVQQLKSEGRARLYGILFDTDSDHLKAESKPTLDALIAAAGAQPMWSFGIEGYADNAGGDAHNQARSEKRALSVKAYLVAAGVDASRLTTQGFGASNPVSSNDTEPGRSQNRRVEVVKK